MSDSITDTKMYYLNEKFHKAISENSFKDLMSCQDMTGPVGEIFFDEDVCESESCYSNSTNTGRFSSDGGTSDGPCTPMKNSGGINE